MNRLLIVIAVLSAELLISWAATEDAGEAIDESVVKAACSWVVAAASGPGVEALGLTCVDLR